MKPHSLPLWKGEQFVISCLRWKNWGTKQAVNFSEISCEQLISLECPVNLLTSVADDSFLVLDHSSSLAQIYSQQIMKLMTNEHCSAQPTTCSRSLRGHCLFVHIFDIIFWIVLEAVLLHGEYLRRDPSLCQHIRSCYRNITDPSSPMRHLWPRGLLKWGVWGRWESQYPYELSCIPNKRKQEQNIDFVQNPACFLHKGHLF